MRSLLILLFLEIVYLPFPQRVSADTVELQINNFHLSTKNSLPPPTNAAQHKTDEKYKPILWEPSILEQKEVSIGQISLDSSVISFEDMSPTTSELRQAIISTDSHGHFATSLVFYLDSRLQNRSKSSFVPPTTCDNGTCTVTNADIWVSSLTYGYGYRCFEGNIPCNTDFASLNAYKQVPLYLENSFPIQSNIINSLRTYSIEYKLNISSSQRLDIYSTHIIYLLLPEL